MNCENCGGEFADVRHPNEMASAPKRFCSERCRKLAERRRTWANKHKPKQIKCVMCGTFFIKKRCQKTCSEECSRLLNKKWREENFNADIAREYLSQYKKKRLAQEGERRCVACQCFFMPSYLYQKKCVAGCDGHTYPRQQVKTFSPFMDKCAICGSEYYKKASCEKYCSDRCGWRAKNIKRRGNPIYKIKRAYYGALHRACSGQKSVAHWRDFFDYSTSDLIKHIESLMLIGMTWQNYGRVWHIDHVKPIKSFMMDGWDAAKLTECFALDNLMPRFATTKISMQYGWNQTGNCNKADKDVYTNV